MVNEQTIWAIFLIPIASFLCIGLVIRPFFNRYSFISGPIAILAIGISFILSLIVFNDVILRGNYDLVFDPNTWLEIGTFKLTIGILLDPLTAIMLVAVTGVSLMVQIYSHGYMRHDPGYRYLIGRSMTQKTIRLHRNWDNLFMLDILHICHSLRHQC